MSIDKFYSRTYDKKKYNCSHFTCEVWQFLTGQDISEQLSGFMRPAKDRFVPYAIRHSFVRLAVPSSPCIVLMQRPGYDPHVGIFLRGRVFHIQERGVEFQPIEVAAIGFNQLRFYDVKKDYDS